MERNSTKKFLIDGFPRNENNLEGWNKIMSDKIDLKGVIFFDCPEEVRTYWDSSLQHCLILL